MTSYEFKRKILPMLVKLSIGLGIGVFVIIIGQGWLFELTFLKNIDLLTIDLRYQSKYVRTEQTRDLKKDGDVVIVGISDDDLKAFIEPFPFPRSYYAHVIKNLNDAGARTIVFDMTWESIRDVQGDSVLRATLQKYNNVVIATKVETGTVYEKAIVQATEPTYNNIFFDVDKNIGVVNIYKDRDDVCRSYFPMLDVKGFLTPSLGFAALNQYFKLPPLNTVKERDNFFYLTRDSARVSKIIRTIPSSETSTFLLNYYGPDHTFRYIPFSQVIDDSTFETKDEFDIRELGEQLNTFDAITMNLVKNKIVIIGSVMAEERDYHNVPLYKEEGGKKNYAMNGVEIHATAIQNVIDSNFITTADPMIESIVIILLSLICFIGLLALKQVRIRHMWLLEIGAFLLTVILVGAVFEVSIIVFSNNNVLMNVVNPSLAVVFAYFGTAVYQYLTERQQKAVIKNMFGHYINPAVVNELVSNPEKAKLGGDRRELTVFFSDIAGFTTISEQYHAKPEGLVALLNEFLDEMTRIVLKFEGTLDKYEGDAIMAFWGAPLPQKDHALRTCLAALEMQKRLESLRPKWIKEGKPPLSVRMGINTGIVIVGNMGGKDRFDYTVIGDSVNLASRLEGANKQYKSNIMVSDFTYTHVKNKVIVRELDLIQVKGKTEPVKVYELLGTADMEMTENQKQSLEMYHEGLKLYRARKWEEAIAYLQQAYSLDETCYVAQIYSERANLYQITPPPAEWNGVFVMTTK
ncbi:MAG: adenylate/guanylate cyclase domain-containing protein [Ignavibacteriales bacterium]|nr:adenylate/guanylate cyclase domain-containing protein [Ignavibacteriales bacterium]